MLTRVFQSGNSIAVRIPKDLAFVQASQDVLIERVGNTLVIRPVPQQTLAGIAEIFAEFSAAFMATFMAEGREFHEEPAREWAHPEPAPADRLRA
jgi:antitoxin VapB